MSEESGHLSEESAGFAAPALDLSAAIALTALSVWVMIESVAMRTPEGIASAPGLLPFLTAATLALMSITVGWQALRRRHEGWMTGSTLGLVNWPRTLLILGVITAYIVALQVLAFEHSFIIAGQRIAIGSFEVISPIAMTVLLVVFWGRSLAVCFALSAIYILVLAQTFRLLFNIPLWH